MRILIEKVLKLLEISRNTGRLQLLSLTHLACASVGFGYDGLSSPEKSEWVYAEHFSVLNGLN
jgi:hypothetical protein